MSSDEISLITQAMVALSGQALWGFIAYLAAKFVAPALVWVVLIVFAFKGAKEFMRQRVSLNRERGMLRGLMAACGLPQSEGREVDQIAYLQMADFLALGMDAKKGEKK